MLGQHANERVSPQASGDVSAEPTASMIMLQVALASGTLVTICDVSFWFLLPRRSALPSLPAAQSRYATISHYQPDLSSTVTDWPHRAQRSAYCSSAASLL